MIWLVVTEYLCHKWPWICFHCHNHNPVPFAHSWSLQAFPTCYRSSKLIPVKFYYLHLVSILSLPTLWVWIPLRRGVLDTTLCDKVCQWLPADRWFSPISKTDSHDITEILLKVALSTITGYKPPSCINEIHMTFEYTMYFFLFGLYYNSHTSCIY